MKRNLILIGIGVVALVAGAVLLLLESGRSGRADPPGARRAPGVPESAVPRPARRRMIADVVPAAKIRKASLLSEKVSGALPPRPVAPGDIEAFNAAMDAGGSVESASKKCFPEGVDTDGILAALKLMAQSKDVAKRRGVYRAVARLFADADDLASATATAKAILESLPTAADDGRQEIDLGDGGADSSDAGGKVVAEKSTDASSESEVVDDSEAVAEGAAAGEAAAGEVEIPASAEVEPTCDAVQGEALEQLLKDGVADADAAVRQEALGAASQMEDHFRYGAYEEALKGGDSSLKKDVLELCSAFSREEDVAVQRQALQDADPDVAATAQKNLDSDAAKAFLKADAAAKAAEPAGEDN